MEHKEREANCSDPEQRSHTEILKSSALIGASTVIVVAIGIIRTKFMAVMLGPAGFGLMGVFNSIVDLAAAIASAGIGGSGVRQIAAAAASDDDARIATTTRVLRGLSLVLGLLGAGAMVLLRNDISAMTFGSEEYGWAVAGLGAAVAFRVVAAGQGALVQGMQAYRRCCNDRTRWRGAGHPRWRHPRLDAW